MNQNKISYWVELSDYDLKTAEVMLEGKRYLYVGFMCHQTVEKILKAYFADKINETPPYTHNLSKLSELSGLDKVMDDGKKTFLFSVQPLNIEARYPSYKDNLLKTLNQENTSDLLNKTKEFQQWVKKMLSKT